MKTVQKITTNLWFDRNAEEAVKFYTSIFKNSSINVVTHYTKEGHEIHGMPEGLVMNIAFTLNDQEFLALNGGPIFKFNEAISLMVNCADQAEIDYFWEKLGEGGDPKAQVCGWLKDKFGLSWQIVPDSMGEMMKNADTPTSSRIMAAMMKMKKIDLAELQRAEKGDY